MECSRRHKPLVKSLNDFLTCKLCHGYLIDATVLVDCLHTFCRACILRHFENGKAQTQCPVCPALYKKKTQCFRADPTIQALVYKSVPALYTKETQRREDFYRSTGMRAGSSCSDDSVIDRERDMMHESEETISQRDKTHEYLSIDDSISLSLEYYQAQLDKTLNAEKKPSVVRPSETVDSTDSLGTAIIAVKNESDPKCDSDKTDARADGKSSCAGVGDKRYLRCPAGVNMKHLQKFVRMKYGLTNDHRVDIIYKGEVLRNDFSLMDVAYTFNWEKTKPMRFFYRIFTPLKIRPIKIVNTPTPTGEKQLQIVPVMTINNHSSTKSPRPEQTSPITIRPPPKSPRVEAPPPSVEPVTKEALQLTESEQQDKEILLANLQLQSKTKALQQAEAKKLQQQQKLQLQQPPHQAKLVKDCVYQYEQPDQEEIKRFAEKRDREWALQKKLEEETKQDKDAYFSGAYVSKKRKKSKHSKSESNGHKEKKRKVHADKIHAEITNNDKSDLKLKVKITSNGHKHKHHKIENVGELSHKEKLLQMRQVRHKPFSGSSGDERSQPAIPPLKVPKTYVNDLAEEPQAKRKKDVLSPKRYADNNNTVESQPVKIKQSDQKRPMPPHGLSLGKVARKEASVRPAVPFDQNALTKQTFLKAAAAHADKHAKDQKIGQGKVEGVKNIAQVLPIGSITTNNKTLDRKIASLQQRCTIEPKNPPNEKSKVMTAQYPPGFTVSKIENGVKRKAEESEQDKRPSLEITLIPPAAAASDVKPAPKRPLPGTIPLEKIKNSANIKSAISIIKMSDNHGVLDLSRKSPESASPIRAEPINGLSPTVNRQTAPNRAPPDTKNILSNLQMLSKVATEYPSMNKLSNKTVRPHLPSLHTISKMQAGGAAVRPPGLQRIPPRLTDIQKFRPMMNAQVRSARPNQNQNIRNIPNPSLVLNRHQAMNQNRIAEKKVDSPKASPPVPVTSSTSAKDVKTNILEQKVDAKEVSV